MFLNGQLSTYHHGDWQMTDIKKRASSNLEWDVAPIPFKNGKVHAAPVTGGL